MRTFLIPLLLLTTPAYAEVSATAPATDIAATPPTNPIPVSTLYSGQQLLAACTDTPALCKGYISGVIDTTETFTVNATQKHWCTAMQGTQDEITAIVIKFLTDHPDKLAQSAQSLVTTALTDAYCPPAK
jgi:hypothetical protein